MSGRSAVWFSAPALGAGGRRFKSSRPDQVSQDMDSYRQDRIKGYDYKTVGNFFFSLKETKGNLIKIPSPILLPSEYNRYSLIQLTEHSQSESANLQ